MIFNSIHFAVFLPLVFCLYWFVFNKNYTRQNLLLLAASYYFYACWDYRFLFLLIFSTALDYFAGLKIAETSNAARRRFWLILSIGINLGFLGVFKYYNFFAESFHDLLQSFGMQTSLSSISIILPVGISFYTFHGLSYIIDVYKNRIPPVRNAVDYSVFVSFFPLLVAGPIERATHLLPQLQQERSFDYTKSINGLRQILWGLFKKIVIADNCAYWANDIFDHHTQHPGTVLALGAVLFAFQIYCDFSGYSDIALGTARLFGIDLLRNFAYPYFSRDIAEFWRRWHISLSSWFRDYVYIPLGGSKTSKLKQVRNTFIIFLLSGFWHGANWTFIAWGLIHALYFIPLILIKRNRVNMNIVAENSALPSLADFGRMLLTFMLVTYAWIFFRAPDLGYAYRYTAGLSHDLFSSYGISSLWHYLTQELGVLMIAVIALFIAAEWMGRRKICPLEDLQVKLNRLYRWPVYYALAVLIFFQGGAPQQFIYFQF